MVHWETSYKYGKSKETEILPLITKYFKRDIQQYTNQYDNFDFYDDLYEYELKSRTNVYSKYPTTMITKNKTEKVTSKKVILLFNFTDGLYFIEYNENQFNKYQSRMFSRLGEKWDEKKHIYIPITDLKKVDLDNLYEDKKEPSFITGYGEVIEKKEVEEQQSYTVELPPVEEYKCLLPIYKRK